MLKILTLTITVILMATLMPTSKAYAAASIGRIVHTYGPAWVQRGITREKATKGQVVLRNDAVVTGARGRVKIIMSDGSKVYIGAKSRVSLRKYSLRGGKLLNARINMLWGKARFFVNKLTSKNASFRVRTPTAVLGVRGTEFIVLVPPTPEVLNLAFANITLDDIPPLPTSTILSEGAVDVSAGEHGQVQMLLPGNTATIDKGGKVTIQETQKGDADIQDIKSKQDNLDKLDKDAEGTAPDPQTKLSPPKIQNLPKRPEKHNINDALKVNTDAIPTDIVNAIQNLDNTTEIIIKPSFVAPDTTTAPPN